MKGINHWAICGSGLSMDSDQIRSLLLGIAKEPFEDLHGKKGLLFSSITLQQFMKEEAIHDDYTLSAKDQRSIRNYSSGEQKKVLLKYLLSKRPDFIILDNVFDMLDASYQNELLERLINISHKISILQIFRRRSEVMPFIDKAIRFQGNEILFSGNINDYDQQFPLLVTNHTDTRIPNPLSTFRPINNPLIKFDHVSVQYNETAILQQINWEINKGEFWQLIGPNGSGKTTLLTMLTGDNPKAYGQNLELFGKKKGSGESIWDIKKNIGYVTPAMTDLFKGRHSLERMVISGIYDSIGLYKAPTFEEKILADKWIELIGLKADKQTYFYKLTEEKQCMVLIARAMIKHPPLLILDEPTHGLDDQLATLLTSLINKIARESSTAIIYVSHKIEKDLNPGHIFELTPTSKGSIGKVRPQNR